MDNFGGDPDRDADTSLSNRNFYRSGIGAIVQMLRDNSRSCRQILMNFLRVECVSQ